jgi:hypothetical protein
MKVLPLLIIGIMLCTSVICQDKSIYTNPVTNSIKIGPLTGNKNLAFGCRNIFQEILQDKDFTITSSPESSDYVLTVDILYFDVNRTKKNISVFHSDKEETLVIMKGLLSDKSGNKIKESVAQESSSEISTSTLITDAGSDKINQQSLSIAIKKTCESLINKLLEKK